MESLLAFSKVTLNATPRLFLVPTDITSQVEPGQTKLSLDLNLCLSGEIDIRDPVDTADVSPSTLASLFMLILDDDSLQVIA